MKQPRGAAIDCPPRSEQDVIKTGNAPLRWIYVVAEALGTEAADAHP